MLIVVEIAHEIDTFLLWCALISPVLAVFLLRKHPIMVGTALAWGILILAGVILGEIDPASRNGFTTFFDLLWLGLGWIPALAYCRILYGLRVSAALVWRLLP